MPVGTEVDGNTEEPVLRILRGRVSDEELAAITVALLRRCRSESAAVRASHAPPVAAVRRACWTFASYQAPSAWAAA
ncbi:acyl-CoA carboxylase subunit epsilon [Kitasatospora sp. NBC_01560]|uniref:acyl-CoA carboxylase subunit epsilon n=1 Tax=Kitasatospora sp. NBC_01560 TaxID=2975965 RepID=UPI003865A783